MLNIFTTKENKTYFGGSVGAIISFLLRLFIPFSVRLFMYYNERLNPC